MISLEVFIRFKLLTYTTISENMIFDFLMKTHEHMLFTYPSLDGIC